MADQFDDTDHRETYRGFIKLTNTILMSLILIVVGMTIGLVGHSMSLGVVVILLGIVGPGIWALITE